jgi:hypothetical protein
MMLLFGASHAFGGDYPNRDLGTFHVLLQSSTCPLEILSEWGLGLGPKQNQAT